jgi:hypothetical protein
VVTQCHHFPPLQAFSHSAPSNIVSLTYHYIVCLNATNGIGTYRQCCYLTTTQMSIDGMIMLEEGKKGDDIWPSDTSRDDN